MDAALRRTLVALSLAAACAQGDQDRGSPPPMLGSHGDGSGTSGADGGSTAGTDASSNGDAATSSASASESGGVSTDDGTLDSTGGADVCAPDPADTPCFACAKVKCCVAYEQCRADMPCDCMADCIQEGGQSSPCNDMCGASEASSAMLLCAFLNCDECMGI